MTHPHDRYAEANSLCEAIESELKRLNRWSAPLPGEAFNNMGAFGSNTMAFEQWIQFILIPRLREIIKSQEAFPSGSSLGTYAMRVFDGDPQTQQLHSLLYQLDNLVATGSREPRPSSRPPTISTGQTSLPSVVYELIEVLHQFEGEDLESQLQTYDMLLEHCSPVVRPELSRLLLEAARRTKNTTSRQRIEQAAQSIENGGRAAEPNNHDAALRKYKEEHNRNFPSAE